MATLELAESCSIAPDADGVLQYEAPVHIVRGGPGNLDPTQFWDGTVRWFIGNTVAAVDGPMQVGGSGVANFSQPRPPDRNTAEGRVRIPTIADARSAFGAGDLNTSVEVSLTPI